MCLFFFFSFVKTQEKVLFLPTRSSASNNFTQSRFPLRQAITIGKFDLTEIGRLNKKRQNQKDKKIKKGRTGFLFLFILFFFVSQKPNKTIFFFVEIRKEKIFTEIVHNFSSRNLVPYCSSLTYHSFFTKKKDKE